MSIMYETVKDIVVRREIYFSSGEIIILEWVDKKTTRFTVNPICADKKINPYLVGATHEFECALHKDYRLKGIIRDYFKIHGNVTGDISFTFGELHTQNTIDQ